MKKIFVLLLMLQCISGISQTEKLKVIPVTDGVEALELVAKDQFGYHYYVKNNVFSKSKEEKTLEYKNIPLGKITKVDLQNPLKIVLFYEDFNTVILLDNQLNEIQKINFSSLVTPVVAGAVAMASQNRLWVYDIILQQIGLYDYLKNNHLSHTQSLQGNLRYYEADFNHFQWIDDQLHWYICDIFGKVSSYGKVPDFEQIHIINPQIIIYLKSGTLFLKNCSTNKTYTIEHNDKSVKSFSYKDQALTIFTTHGISNYKIIIP
ncbi:MAG TPA: hypothetical protein VF677_06945 [Flavobacterium sp.]|jgi:hypothetical protein